MNETIARRYRVLALAEELGSVSEACRRCGVTRSQFYKYRQRFRDEGLAGLAKRPPVHKSHPHMTPPAVVARLLELTREEPTWGCVQLSRTLQEEGIALSHATVQQILNRHGLGTRFTRLLQWEERFFRDPTSLARDQLALLEKNNPCFRHRATTSVCAGSVIVHDTLWFELANGHGRLYLNAALDTTSNYAFARFVPAPTSGAAAALLYREVAPFFKARERIVSKVLTDRGPEFWGGDGHPYRQLLTHLSGWYVVQERGTGRWVHGALRRFHQTVAAEFLPTVAEVGSLDALHEPFAAWLAHYNTARPFLGYPNQGRPPLEVVETAPRMRLRLSGARHTPSEPEEEGLVPIPTLPRRRPTPEALWGGPRPEGVKVD